MTKEEAIVEIKRVQNGGGVDRNAYLDRVPRGRIAETAWNEGLFTLGIEYGYIIALVKLFDIQPGEL